MADARIAIRHGKDAIRVLEGTCDARAPMMFQDRDIDELEVGSVGRACPEPFTKFDTVSACGCEAGIGDLIDHAVTVGGVVGGRDGYVTDRVEKVRGHRAAAENGVHEVIDRQEVLFLGVYPDVVVDIGPS
jgi:hypothetical protein